MLVEKTLTLSDKPLTKTAARFVRQARSRFDSVDCFSFVPSNYELAWQFLDCLPRGRFCEWGSGFGVVTGLAEMLGFDAFGIESDAGLVEASRSLLAEFGLAASILQGDYLEHRSEADVYFVYCWPSQMSPTELHFERIAPADARLLICHGQSDIRCKFRVCD